MNRNADKLLWLGKRFTQFGGLFIGNRSFTPVLTGGDQASPAMLATTGCTPAWTYSDQAAPRICCSMA